MEGEVMKGFGDHWTNINQFQLFLGSSLCRLTIHNVLIPTCHRFRHKHYNIGTSSSCKNPFTEDSILDNHWGPKGEEIYTGHILQNHFLFDNKMQSICKAQMIPICDSVITFSASALFWAMRWQRWGYSVLGATMRPQKGWVWGNRCSFWDVIAGCKTKQLWSAPDEKWAPSFSLQKPFRQPSFLLHSGNISIE